MSDSLLHTRKILPHLKKKRDAKNGMSNAHKIHAFTHKLECFLCVFSTPSAKTHKTIFKFHDAVSGK